MDRLNDRVRRRRQEAVDEVRAFCLVEAWNISPYSQPEHVMSSWELFQEARRRSGDLACDDLLLWLH
jgi:hypothetical protein